MFNKSLDTILGSFTKVQADLEIFISKGHQQRVDNAVKIAELEAINTAVANDLEKAANVKANIEALLG